MRSPIITLLLVVLGWPLAMLLLITGYVDVHDWMAARYPSPSLLATEVGPQFPAYRHIATNALAALRLLPPPEQAAVVTSLGSGIASPRRWLSELDRSSYRLICLGEQHDDRTRRFLSRVVFPHLRLDTLMLETTQPELSDMRAEMQAGRAYLPLHGADITGVLRAVAAKRPPVRIEGIDETEIERERRLTKPDEGFRDDSLTRNFRSLYRPGERTVLLFGAFHCLDEPRLLFRQVRSGLPRNEAAAMLSVRVIGEHEGGPVEAFVYFLDALDLRRGSLAIPHPDELAPMVRSWFRIFTQETLDRYGAVVVVGSRAGDGPRRSALTRSARAP